ncbi:membrane protein, partial [Paenibacillus terrae]
MAEQIQQLEAGNIKISNDVVGKIAGMAALETPG